MQTTNRGIQSPIFFALYKPTDTKLTNSDGQDDYIDMPSIKIEKFEQLLSQECFEKMKMQFLADINKLKQLTNHYLNDRYDKAIDIFYEKIEYPTVENYSSLLTIYRDTRYQIHRMIAKIKECSTSKNPPISPDEITNILNNCLDGIDLCLGGVHGRFMRFYPSLEAIESGLLGKIFTIRRDLFHEFTKGYLFEKRREGILEIPNRMDAHWVNGVHNLFYKQIGLNAVEDVLANQNFTDADIATLLSSLSVKINEYTIVQKLTDDCFEKLCLCLENLTLSNWLTTKVKAKEMTSERLDTLEIQVFNPVNRQLQAKKDRRLNLWTIIEEEEKKDDTYLYSFNRSPEKLQMWMTSALLPEISATVFTKISLYLRTTTYIGTIGSLFFWVFKSKQHLNQYDTFSYDPDNHITLQLSHLKSINLASWDEATCIAILAQAMKQSNNPSDIADFFLNTENYIKSQKKGIQIIQMMANLLTDKLLDTKLTNKKFKEQLVETTCKYFVNRKRRHSSDGITLRKRGTISMLLGHPLTKENTRWFIDTPLLEPVLCELKYKHINISIITDSLTTWRISDFSLDTIKKCLTLKQCETLFSQSLLLEQGKVMGKLLLTGYCDGLTNNLNKNKKTPLLVLSKHGVTSGIEYILSNKGAKINHQDKIKYAALHYAARFGRVDCLKLLLKSGADINICDKNDWTALMLAARFCHLDCVDILLSSITPQIIDVNIKTTDGDTALHSGTYSGHTGIVQRLLKYDHSVQSINAQDKKRWTPLMFAARKGYEDSMKLLLESNAAINLLSELGNNALMLASRGGHENCVKYLIENSAIELNTINIDGDTALIMATSENHASCVKVLLKYKSIDVNIRNKENKTALAISVQSEYEGCTQLLLDHPNILVNTRIQDEGRTPLIIASIFGCERSVRQLLQHKDILINKSCRDHCRTALEYANEAGNTRCAQLLIEHGATSNNPVHLSGLLLITNSVNERCLLM